MYAWPGDVLISVIDFCFQISQLVEEVSRLQQSLQRLQETSAQTTARLEEELEARRQHISRLESKLERQRDYDDLKREINALRSVDLSQIPTGEPGKSLEHLLMERSKALQQTESLKPSSNTPDALGESITINFFDAVRTRDIQRWFEGCSSTMTKNIRFIETLNI